jgi:Glycosyltransferases involved in cell wall biogenesis
MKEVKVSIIIPLYNRAELVKETIHSVIAQTLQFWEMIIVDDHSTDNSWDVVQAFSQLDERILCYKKPLELQKGPSSSRNFGAKLAKGDCLIFLDSDDLITATCLEKRIQSIIEKPELDFMVFPQATFDFIPEKDAPLFSRYFATTEEYLKSFLKETPPWQTSGPLWKKEKFLALGGFKENYSMMEDPELHIRAILRGLKFEVIQGEPDFFYRLLPKTKEQEVAFYKHSIEGRIVFYKDMYAALSAKEWQCYRSTLGVGVILFLKQFLLPRSNEYEIEARDVICWALKNKLISPWTWMLMNVYLLAINNVFAKRLPYIRGGVYRCI